jgi:hypothetical protein
VVIGVWLLYMVLANPYQGSADIPEGDALEVVEKLRRIGRGALHRARIVQSIRGE